MKEKLRMSKGNTGGMRLVAVRPMGVLGRVVIPSEVRGALGLVAGCYMGIYVDGDTVVLRAVGARGIPTFGGRPRKH